VRITHLPTGIVVSCQNERSQLQNKTRAMQVLRARLAAAAEEEAAKQASAARASQVRTVDRSERVRTYNFPENRISDHRVNYKAYNLDQVLNGDLDGVLDALATADRDERLAAHQSA
jgi:peptide chain release factor 1